MTEKFKSLSRDLVDQLLESYCKYSHAMLPHAPFLVGKEQLLAQLADLRGFVKQVEHYRKWLLDHQSALEEEEASNMLVEQASSNQEAVSQLRWQAAIFRDSVESAVRQAFQLFDKKALDVIAEYELVLADEGEDCWMDVVLEEVDCCKPRCVEKPPVLFADHYYFADELVM